MMNLTTHFTLEELTASSAAQRLGIDNRPDAEAIKALTATASMMEVVRGLLNGAAIHVDSGYRSPGLNAHIGGAPTSAHCRGLAVDFVAPSFGTPLEICRAIAASQVPFDQLIQEGTWVHISFAQPMRRDVLTAHFAAGHVTYTRGIA